MLWCQGLKLWRKDGVSSSLVGLTRNDLRSGAVGMWNRIVDAVAESHGWARLVADATNAFFHAAEDEDICGECSPEFNDQLAAEGEDTDVLFKFVKKVYGRRDGPQGFCDFVNGVMCQKNLIRCEALPCFFLHENLHILVEFHQDDFHCTAPVGSLIWLKDELRDEIRLKFCEIVYQACATVTSRRRRQLTIEASWSGRVGERGSLALR